MSLSATLPITEWLAKIGLERYAPAFVDNDIDVSVLRHLTDTDLEKIGVSLGHRRKILAAIGELSKTLAAPAAALAPSIQAPAITSAAEATAERRQVTVMFSDLVGSTALSARMDPEDLREVISAYQKFAAETVQRFGGYVAKYMGDGILVYFGYPQAHEDNAERAVRAGLALVKGIGQLNTAAGEPLNARIGIATGLVIVGDLIGSGESQERGIAGDTPNLAARLQEHAETGAVILSDRTRRLLGDLFELTKLTPAMLKGFTEPVQAWRVLGEGRAESRFEALHGARLTPLVGRGEELELVLSRWRQAKEGNGQVALISGEPGIGKSRLVLALRERLHDDTKATLTYACSPHHVHSALFPFIVQLERSAGFSPTDSWKGRLNQLSSMLRETVTELGDVLVALFAELLGIPTGTQEAIAAMSPLQKKGLLFRTFLAQLEGLAARGAVLIVLEDAHWLDPTSRELFDQIVDRLQRLPVLLVVTFRPDLSPPWIGFPHVTLLTINRLAEAQTRSLVERVTGGKALPSVVLEQILTRTEGVPLFTEELTKTVLESGFLSDAGDHYVLAGPLPPLAIPATLHDSLMARLDRLAPVKEVAQVGACIGREFDHQLLAAVVSLPEAELEAALDRLVAAELVFRRGVAPATAYIFKHSMVRDAAYESLLRKRRQDLHARIAAAIELRFPQIIEAQPELVARHFGEAGLTEKAIGYWLQAGQLAAARSANVEAVAHLSVGLASINDLVGSSRPRWELSLQLALGGPLIATKGFASSEVEAAYLRAQDLSQELGQDTNLFTAVRGLGYVHHVRGDLRQCMKEFPEAIELAHRIGDPALLVQAYHFAGVSTFHLGAFQSARDWLRRSLEAGDFRGRYHSELYGINMGVFCNAYIAHCDWHLGYADYALNSAKDALSVARQVSHPFSIALALAYLAMLHQFRREPEAALQTAEEARGLCQEYRFDYYGAWSALVRAWAIAEQGRTEEGASAYDAALKEFRNTGANLRMPHYLGLLAGIHRKAGRRSAGLKVLTEAKQIAEKNHETWCNARLELEHAELLLLEASEEAGTEADAAFKHAIDIAASQGAKTLEL
ncbi:MAG TPA: adenylate/guanylate cyclase domain-containing protein, partial [Steroidobacteraceae bacterium]|nr:adenylate/guanylate cyclase domain-containing protein [Steroidobacteraceae bacterium]